MKKKTTKKLRVETRRTSIYRTRIGLQPHWCPYCGPEVAMTGIEMAARGAGMRQRAVFRLIESGALHSTEDEDGRMLVCLNSLRQCFTKLTSRSELS